MTTVVPGANGGSASHNWMARILAIPKNLIVGTLLCLTPVTAIIVLGWMMRYMRNVSLRRLGAPGGWSTTGWMFADSGNGPARRLFGGLWLNILTGFGGAASLALATLPFTGLWLIGWWAGWENSFNKGYEQFMVGRVMGLSGVALGLIVMSYLPMAMAHQSMEGSWRAFFQTGRVRALMANAGWRYVFHAAAMVIAAVPLFGSRGLPVFIEQIIPGFAEFDVAKTESIAGMIAVAKGFYVFVSLVVLRRWMALIYAHAARRAVAANSEIWAGSVVERQIRETGISEAVKKPWLVFRIIRLVLLPAIWFGLVAQIFVAQFLNLDWLYWVNHPYLLLPWMP